MMGAAVEPVAAVVPSLEVTTSAGGAGGRAGAEEEEEEEETSVGSEGWVYHDGPGGGGGGSDDLSPTERGEGEGGEYEDEGEEGVETLWARQPKRELAVGGLSSSAGRVDGPPSPRPSLLLSSPPTWPRYKDVFIIVGGGVDQKWGRDVPTVNRTVDQPWWGLRVCSKGDNTTVAFETCSETMETTLGKRTWQPWRPSRGAGRERAGA